MTDSTLYPWNADDGDGDTGTGGGPKAGLGDEKKNPASGTDDTGSKKDTKPGLGT